MLDGMTSSPVSVSLRPSPSNEAAATEQLTLAHVLARITTEHGPTFANVTEEKLQTQIDKLDDEDDADMEDINPNNDAKQVTREDLIKIVQVAFEESSLAQDFTSLLLSSARPAAGGASMSPALKAVVPLGALSGARIFPQPSQKTDLDVSIGWKKSALEGASQTLLSTADRMTRNLGNTGRFVDGVLKIRAAGWGIVQMPAGGGEAQQGVLKVYYGFQKAGSDYHDPGVGYLKESRSGEIVFTKEARFADKKDRTLRIRVESKDGTETSFSGPKDFRDEGLSEVEIELIKARDSLFDEELYHELTKEARIMSNSGVVITEIDIQVPLANESKVFVDLIDAAADEPASPSPFASAVLHALHILLSHAHHLNLKKRQEVPEPLSLRKSQNRPMTLLRPLLAYATHSNLLSLAETYFSSLLEPFKTANLPCSLEISRFSNLVSITNNKTPADLLETLLTTAQSTLTLLLPADYTLSLQIQTPYQHSQSTYQWLPPFTIKTSSLSSIDGEMSFDALSDAESPIMSAVEESLAETTLQILGPSWRKINLREFENAGQRIRVEIRGGDQQGHIIVLSGLQEIECQNRSLRDVLVGIMDGRGL